MVSVNDSGSCSNSDTEDYDHVPQSNGNPLERNYMTDYVASNQHSTNPKTVRRLVGFPLFIFKSLFLSQECPPLISCLKSLFQYAFAKNYVSPSASVASSSQSETVYRNERQMSSANSAAVANNVTPPHKPVVGVTQLYGEILNEIKRANALADLEREETSYLHKEMRDLELQRFSLTQMFVEKSLSLQQQMLKCLQSNNGMRSPALTSNGQPHIVGADGGATKRKR